MTITCDLNSVKDVITFERMLTLDISSPVKMNSGYMKNESLVHSKRLKISWKKIAAIYLSIRLSLNEILLSINVWCVVLVHDNNNNEAFVLHSRISIARDFIHIYFVSIFGSLMSSIDVFAERFHLIFLSWFVLFQNFSQLISLKCVRRNISSTFGEASSQMVIKRCEYLKWAH